MLDTPARLSKQRPRSSLGELTTALRAYLEVACRTLVPRTTGPQRRRQLVLLPPTVRVQLDECESSQRWKELWQAWDRVRPSRGLDSPGSELARWFRRRGIYLDCLTGPPPAAETVARRLLHDARLHANGATKYLVLMDGVIFGKKLMRFGYFDIARLSEKQLERILETRTNRTFFPMAVQDSKPFSDLWYLVVTQKLAARDSDAAAGSGFCLDTLFNTKPRQLRAEFSALPTPIAEATKTLLLWPWWRDSRDHALLHRIPSFEQMLMGAQPSFPIVFAVNSSPFASPVEAPPPGIRYFAPLPPLELSLDPNHEGWNRWMSHHPQFSQNGASERTTGRSNPSPGWDGGLRVLDAEDTNEFEKFVISTLAARAQITETNSCAWWELSLSFLLKAWNSKGLDQLLWEVVAMEALLGDRIEILASIKRRIEALLGPQIQLPDTVVKSTGFESTQKLFAALYNLRSKLVHGDRLKGAHEDYLRIGLGLAREVAIRMLLILSKLADFHANEEIGRFPERSEILHALDQARQNQADSLPPLAQMMRRILRGE